MTNFAMIIDKTTAKTKVPKQPVITQSGVEKTTMPVCATPKPSNAHTMMVATRPDDSSQRLPICLLELFLVRHMRVPFLFEYKLCTWAM